MQPARNFLKDNQPEQSEALSSGEVQKDNLLPQEMIANERQSIGNILEHPAESAGLSATQLQAEYSKVQDEDADQILFNSAQEMLDWFVQRAAGENEQEKTQIAKEAIAQLKKPNKQHRTGLIGHNQEWASQILAA